MKTFQFLSLLLLVLSSIAFLACIVSNEKFLPSKDIADFIFNIFFLAVMKEYTYMFLFVLILHGFNKPSVICT